MSLIVYACIAQITSIVSLSEKVYNDNTKTVYFQINGSIPQCLKSEIEDEIADFAQVKLFSFYNETDLSSCMITCSNDFDLNVVVDTINNLISRNSDSNHLFDLSGTFYEKDYKVVKCRAEFNSDFVDYNALLKELHKIPGMILSEVSEEGVFKIILSKNTPWFEVNKVFSENGVKEIIPIF